MLAHSVCVIDPSASRKVGGEQGTEALKSVHISL